MKIGQRFGRWTVLEDLGGKQYRKLLCQCECDTQRAVRLSHLRNGSSLSCGCLSAEQARDRGGNIEPAQAGLSAKLHDGTGIEFIARPLRQSNRNSATGVLGVSPYYKRFKATLKLRGKQIYLGVYDTVEEAAEARKKGEEIYYRPIVEMYEKQKLDDPDHEVTSDDQ